MPTLKHPFLEKCTKPCHVECGLQSSALLALRATQALTTRWWLVKLLPYIYSLSTWFGFLWLTLHIHCVCLLHVFYLDISCSLILLKLKKVKLSLQFLLFLISSLRKSYEYDQLHPLTNSLQIHILSLLSQHCILLYFKTHQVPFVLPVLLDAWSSSWVWLTYQGPQL